MHPKQYSVGAALPPFLGAFVGRADETAEIGALVATARLFTLTGAGGSGKTRLAAQLAASMHDRFAHGVRWIDLSALSDPALVPDVVAAGCRVAEQGASPTTELLIAALRPQRLLLVFDNCEHLLAACATLVERLLVACPDLRVLTTSREPLAIPGEVVWLVTPLSVPADDSGETLAAIEAYEAVQLFVARATAALPSFRLTAANAPTVAYICRQVAGLPLGLELAAAQLRALSLDDLAARLDDATQLLTRGSRTAPPRQQTLRAALDWSYSLLTEPEREVFCRLGVFAGSFAAAAAEAICAEEGTPEATLLDSLTGLVEKSLVVVQERAQPTRYRLLEPLRQYALGRLAETGALHPTQVRHRNWYAALATEATTALAGPEQGAWNDQLALEHDNLRAALGWSLAQGDVANAGAIIIGIWPFWLQRGHLRESCHWLEQTLAALPHPTPLRAQLLWIAGITARPDAQRAQRCLAESAALSQQFGDQEMAARAFGSLAFLAQALGDHPLAMTYFEQGLPLARAANDTVAPARMLSGLALSLLASGDTERARAVCHEGLELHRQAGDQRGVGAALANLGLLWQARGDDQRAAAYWEESLAVRRHIGDEGGIAHLLTLLGGLAVRQQAYGRATELYTDSLAMRQRMGEFDGVPPIFEGLAAVAAAIGEFHAGVWLLAAADALRATIKAQPSAPEHDAHAQTLATLREHLRETAFDDAWAHGQRLTLEQAASIAAQLLTAATGTDAPVEPSAPAPGPTAHAASLAAHSLTPRELDVLRLLSQGLTYAQIGEQLVISPRTVDAHLRTIFSKLGVRSRTAATRIALEQQLV